MSGPYQQHRKKPAMSQVGSSARTINRLCVRALREGADPNKVKRLQALAFEVMQISQEKEQSET